MSDFDVIVLGSYNQDHVWSADALPSPGETRLGRFATGPGGKGFNQAVACHRQGVKTLFLGALGDDALARQARDTAQAFGLPCAFEVHADAATGSAGIVVDAAGRNQIVVAPGANAQLSPGFVHAHAAAIRGAKVLVCQLESNLEATRAALTLARDAAVTAILNPAPIHAGLDPLLAALPHVLTPNESEFAFLLAHLHGQPLAPNWLQFPDPMLHLLCRRLAAPTVVITLGEHGCFVSHADATLRADGNAHYRLPAEAVTPVDTVGAGDAFTGGLAAGLILHGMAKPFRDAVRHANRVAACSTERAGAAAAMPTRREVEARFA